MDICRYNIGVLLLWSSVLLLASTTSQVGVVAADGPTSEDGDGEEVGADQELAAAKAHHNNTGNVDSSSLEVGPPDSHEAMNNREISPGAREKRSYEFLMGLVNNHSKYEVTRPDPEAKKRRLKEEEESNSAASELLLELMVKISAHPDHWTKVHELLQKIDHDLLASKKVVEELNSAKIPIQNVFASGQPTTTTITPLISMEKKEDPHADNHHHHNHNNNDNDNDAGNKGKSRFSLSTNEWPQFQDRTTASANTVAPSIGTRHPPHGSYHPNLFAYHRVTGRPLYINKNPKAYIAVSVIAPKPMDTRPVAQRRDNDGRQDEDVVLEKELRQLKPWSHEQNLENMAAIRSRWVIQREDDDKKSEAAAGEK